MSFTGDTVGKVKCGSKVILPAIPVVLIGANVNNKPNCNVLGNFGIIQPHPSPTILYISP